MVVRARRGGGAAAADRDLLQRRRAAAATPAAAAPPAGEKKPKTQVTQPKDVQPLIQPKEPEPEKPKEEDEGEEGGEEGGVKGGVKGGVAGGVVGGVLGGTGEPKPVEAPPPPPPPKPKNVAHAPDASEWLNHPEPHVPEAITIQRKGTGEATFFAVVCLDMAGRVTDVKVKQGIPGADDAIIRVVRTWVAKPQPIPICFPFRATFIFE